MKSKCNFIKLTTLSSLLIAILIINFSTSKVTIPPDDPAKNNNLVRPIIGIISDPHPINNDDTRQSTLSLAYVRFAEDFGIKVIPLFWDYPEDKLQLLIPKLNGLLFPGGDRNFVKGLWEAQYRKIVTIGIAAKVPIYFICQGFEYLHYYLTNDNQSILTNFNSYKVYLPMTIIESELKNSKMFSEFTNNELISYQEKYSTVHYHHLGVNPEDFKRAKVLDEELRITSVGKDLDGKPFIGSVESKDFNNHKFFAVQFHPEKSLYDQQVDFMKENSSVDAIRVARVIFSAYVKEVLIKKEEVGVLTQDEQKELGLIDLKSTLPNLNGCLLLYDNHNLVKNVD